MARKQPEMRKQELLQIATRQFVTQGYEKTSIRSIVGEAGGEIGMFYHHFASKDEIFRAVLEQFNADYVREAKTIVETSDEQRFAWVFETLLTALENSIASYSEMDIQAMDAQILAILHHNTLVTLRPCIADMIDIYARKGEVAPLPGVDSNLMAEFLLSGISAVVHDRSMTDMVSKKEAIRTLSFRLLGVDLSSK